MSPYPEGPIRYMETLGGSGGRMQSEAYVRVRLVHVLSEAAHPW
jgi:hypothetical protein